LAIDFINDDVTYGDKPFFMYFNPTVPHNSGDVLDALQNGDCTSTTNGIQPEPLIKGMNLDFAPGGCRAYRQDVINRAGTKDNKQLGAVWLDDAVGALLTALEDKGILDDTIFLFQLDHGMVAKSELLEGGTRIPQFIHYPKEFGTTGMNFEGMVSTVDIGPTLLDYADITTLSPGYYDMDGVSWRDAVGDDPVELTWNSQRCLLFEYDTDRAVRCACEKYATVDGVEYYHDLCDASGHYLDYSSGIDPEATNQLTADTQDRAELLEDIMACYLTKTEPSSDRDFTTYECAEPYQTMAPNAAPSTAPTTLPSLPPTTIISVAPSISPTADCVNALEFFIDGGTKRDCKWVADRPKRCKDYGCDCPVTCNKCRICEESESPI
jgi:arylsulfatase A-like enzyme